MPEPANMGVTSDTDVTIDGVSLTVNDVNPDNFRLTIIPHTMKETLFRNYKPPKCNFCRQ